MTGPTAPEQGSKRLWLLPAVSNRLAAAGTGK